MDRHFITRSGRSVRISYDQLRPTRNHDSLTLDLNVSSTSTAGPARVFIDAPPLTAAAYQHGTGSVLTPQVRDELVVLAVVNAVDQDPELIGTQGSPFEVWIHAGNVVEIGSPRRLTDREIRRWLTRRVYDEYTRADLDVLVRFDNFDLMITGTRVEDLWRNAQLLGEEGYFRVERGMGVGNYSLQPTPKLIREVERYGSAREDVLTERDFEDAVASYAILAARRDEIVPEYHRFRAAVTSQEVTSVFRAIAPTVEAVLRDVLRAHGCSKDLPTLGPMNSGAQNSQFG